jgi:hypothetical protein
VRDIMIGEDTLSLPSGVTLRRARPAVLPVQLIPTRTVSVPVVVPTIGVLPETLELVNIRAEPDTANLIVPEGTAGPDQVPTEALDLQETPCHPTRFASAFEREFRSYGSGECSDKTNPGPVIGTG